MKINEHGLSQIRAFLSSKCNYVFDNEIINALHAIAWDAAKKELERLMAEVE